MVRLYGVIHGGCVIDFWGRSREVQFYPSESFKMSLLSLPEKSRVGIENLTTEDWSKVKSDANRKSRSISYPPQTPKFWDDVRSICERAGHEVIFLESPDLWLKYNSAMAKFARASRREIYRDNGETDLDYHGKLIRHNEARHRAEIMAKKIHDVDRDDALLEAIKREQVSVAIVGKGHSDFWFANRQTIENSHGIQFGQYSTDGPEFEGEFFNTFTKNAEPDPKLVFRRTGLERANNIITSGRVVDGTPNFVGIWEVICSPSEGYFELFIEDQQGPNVSGRIEDFLGSATFQGRLTQDSFNFRKVYERFQRGAMEQPLEYASRRVNGTDFIGNFIDYEGYKRPFIMRQGVKESPVNLSMAWEEQSLMPENNNGSDGVPEA